MILSIRRRAGKQNRKRIDAGDKCFMSSAAFGVFSSLAGCITRRLDALTS
jgi:hypothetical protein